MKCHNCPRETENADYCDECMLRISALKKSLAEPEELAAMRAVMEGKPANTPLRKVFKNILVKQPLQFQDRLTKARESWQNHLRLVEAAKEPAKVTSGAAGACPTCGHEAGPVDEGSERVEELCLKILAQARKDAGLGPLEGP